MSYKLAKQLKDAGFPQYGKGEVSINVNLLSGETPKEAYERGSYDYVPTLSELIEACGDRFVSLSRSFDDHLKTAYWQAIGLQGEYPQVANKNVLSQGDTPEEAVVRLWLALQKTQ